MKSSETIVSQVFVPFGAKWQERRCVKNLLHFLPQSLSRGVRYAKFQNSILIVAVESASIRAEFYQKKAVIKAIFERLKQTSKICADQRIDDFKIITLPPKIIYEEPQKPTFDYELSTGEFKNPAQNDKIHKKIEEIKALIREKRAKILN